MNQGLFLCYICYVFDERPLRATGVTWHYCTCWLQACIGVGIIVVTMGPKFYRCLDLEPGFAPAYYYLHLPLSTLKIPLQSQLLPLYALLHLLTLHTLVTPSGIKIQIFLFKLAGTTYSLKADSLFWTSFP
nr:hypothetical protein CFP56_10557 [Quercus suber]